MNNALDTLSLPWIPLGPGESFKPLHFYPDNRARALLLRLEPGTVVPRHRHLGDVQAFNLSGQRQLDTGEVVGRAAMCTSRSAMSTRGKPSATSR
jgi:2,4'-dihydroxyacetophenone dioxygenase